MLVILLAVEGDPLDVLACVSLNDVPPLFLNTVFFLTHTLMNPSMHVILCR